MKEGEIENIKKEEDKLEISETGKKVVEEEKKVSDKEILSLNTELSKSDTKFLEYSLKQLKRRLSTEDFKNFNKAISKYPVVDLACGQPDKILNFLFKEKWHNRYDYYDKEVVDEAGIMEPPKYIGVDKYHENFTSEPNEKLSDRVKFEKKDIIKYLRTLPDNSVNIFIGGFDWEISQPEAKFIETSEGEGKMVRQEDKYRAIMVSEIARVLAEDGYCLSAESNLSGEWNGKDVTLEDFGLKKILLKSPMYGLAQNTKLFKKAIGYELEKGNELEKKDNKFIKDWYKKAYDDMREKNTKDVNKESLKELLNYVLDTSFLDKPIKEFFNNYYYEWTRVREKGKSLESFNVNLLKDKLKEHFKEGKDIEINSIRDVRGELIKFSEELFIDIRSEVLDKFSKYIVSQKDKVLDDNLYTIRSYMDKLKYYISRSAEGLFEIEELIDLALEILNKKELKE